MCVNCASTDLWEPWGATPQGDPADSQRPGRAGGGSDGADRPWAPAGDYSLCPGFRSSNPRTETIVVVLTTLPVGAARHGGEAVSESESARHLLSCFPNSVRQ